MMSNGDQRIRKLFKAEADEILFEDLHFNSGLKECVRQEIGRNGAGRNRKFIPGRLQWTKGVLVAVILILVAIATPELRDYWGGRMTSKTPQATVPNTRIDKLGSGSHSLLQGDRMYPLPDAVPARITYQLDTVLPKAPAQTRSFRVDRSKLTEADVKDLALKFGFINPQVKRINDNAWVVGQDGNGESITETWPTRKGQPGQWLEVFDSRHLFWYDNLSATTSPASPVAVGWMEDAARAWLQKFGLDPGAEVGWKPELHLEHEPPMLLWMAMLDGFPVPTTEAQFAVAGDGQIKYASFPLWRVEPLVATPLKTTEEAFSELQARQIRLDKKTGHTVTISKVELMYGDPGAYGTGDVELFFHFQGKDDNGEDFNQYIYARKDKTGRAPWERA